jgi:hypothetical protein
MIARHIAVAPGVHTWTTICAVSRIFQLPTYPRLSSAAPKGISLARRSCIPKQQLTPLWAGMHGSMWPARACAVALPVTRVMHAHGASMRTDHQHLGNRGTRALNGTGAPAGCSHAFSGCASRPDAALLHRAQCAQPKNTPAACAAANGSDELHRSMNAAPSAPHHLPARHEL